ncbi:hypothetical protein FHT82_001132 [Rhizobium sp. BK275]|nr:hypothetical protein [Rhizobium sp. BK275]MBB3407767.1 hypothetical protein [Rhizobium sp. BK316]
MVRISAIAVVGACVVGLMLALTADIGEPIQWPEIHAPKTGRLVNVVPALDTPSESP